MTSIRKRSSLITDEGDNEGKEVTPKNTTKRPSLLRKSAKPDNIDTTIREKKRGTVLQPLEDFFVSPRTAARRSTILSPIDRKRGTLILSEQNVKTLGSSNVASPVVDRGRLSGVLLGNDFTFGEQDEEDDILNISNISTGNETHLKFHQARARKTMWDEEKEHRTSMKFMNSEARRSVASVEKKERRLRQGVGVRLHLWLRVICSINLTQKVKSGTVEFQSLQRLRKCFLPLFWRWRWVRHNKQIRREREAAVELLIEQKTVDPPSPEHLRRIELFQNWPDRSLRTVSRSMKPCIFKPNEYILMEGDWGGDCLYIIGKGSVDVTVRNPKERGIKSHKDPSRVHLATISENTERPFFGEFAVLLNEPRSATVTSNTLCYLWSLNKSVVDDMLSMVPEIVRKKVEILAASRRTQILSRLYPLSTDLLRSANEIFRCWNETMLTSLVEQFLPKVCSGNVRVFEEKAVGDFFYFIANGQVSIQIDGVEVENLTSGESFGDVSILFLERRSASAITRRPTDFWILPKQKLLDALFSNPSWFIAAKETVNIRRASWMPKTTVAMWLSTPLGDYTPPVVMRRILQDARPIVAEKGHRIISTHGAMDNMYLLVSGLARSPDRTKTYTGISIIGIYDVLTFQPGWTVTIVAEEKCEVWAIPIDIFWRALLAKKAFYRGLVSTEVQHDLTTIHTLPLRSPSQVLLKYAPKIPS